MDISEITAWAAQNPEAVVIAGGAAVQGITWAVKKSPWGWDDDLWGWCVKNKGGLSLVFKSLKKNK